VSGTNNFIFLAPSDSVKSSIQLPIFNYLCLPPNPKILERRSLSPFPALFALGWDGLCAVRFLFKGYSLRLTTYDLRLKICPMLCSTCPPKSLMARRRRMLDVASGLLKLLRYIPIRRFFENYDWVTPPKNASNAVNGISYIPGLTPFPTYPGREIDHYKGRNF